MQVSIIEIFCCSAPPTPPHTHTGLFVHQYSKRLNDVIYYLASPFFFFFFLILIPIITFSSICIDGYHRNHWKVRWNDYSFSEKVFLH